METDRSLKSLKLTESIIPTGRALPPPREIGTYELQIHMEYCIPAEAYYLRKQAILPNLASQRISTSQFKIASFLATETARILDR